MSIKLGQLTKVENKSRHFGSSTEYNIVYVEQGTQTIPLCLTNTELEAARTRAKNNTEDLPKFKLSIANWVSSLFS